MTISQESRDKIYDKLEEIQKLLQDMRLVYLPLSRAIRKLGWMKEEKFLEEVGEEYQKSLNHDHERANKIIRQVDLLVKEIIGLLESEK